MSDAFRLTFALEPESYRNLLALYERAPDRVVAELTVGVELGALDAEREVRVRTPRDTSRAANSISHRIDTNGARVVAVVSPNADGGSGPVEYVVYLETGTRPGKMPPLRVIQEWVHRKGIGGVVVDGRLKSRAPEDVERQIAWRIAWKLKHHGSKGHHMFRDGAEAARPAVERHLNDAYQRVVDYLQRGD